MRHLGITLIVRPDRRFGRRRLDVTARFRQLSRDTSASALLAAARDPSPEVARRALGWLAQSAGPAELGELHTLIWTCDPANVADVARTLRALGDEVLFDDAVGRLRHSPPAQRCRAAGVLARLGDRRAIPPLCRALEDRDGSVRGEALEALSHFDRDPGAAAAAAALLSDPDAEVRRRAVRAVSRLVVDLPPAVRAAVVDPAAWVRREVAGLAARLPADDVERLVTDADREVRRSAVDAARIAAVNVIGSVLTSERDPGVRLAAARTLGRLGGSEATAALVAAAIHDDAAVVRAAALRGAREALTEARLRDSLREVLASAAGHSHPMALRTLAKLPGHVDQADALHLARDPDPEVRLALAQVAADLAVGPDAILETLREDDDPTVAHAAHVHSRVSVR